MAYLMLRVEIPALDAEQINGRMQIDSTNPHEGVVLIRNLMDSLLAGTTDGEVAIAVRATTQSISADGGGDSGSYNLK